MSAMRLRHIRPADEVTDRTRKWRLYIALMLIGLAILHLAFPGTWATSDSSHVIHWSVLFGYLMLAWFRLPAASPSISTKTILLRRLINAEVLVSILGLSGGAWWPLLAAASLVLLLSHAWTAYLWLLRQGINPGLIFVGSFATVILVGAAALKLPGATPDGETIGWIDAIFTSTSAACVTGLVVMDTDTGFTRNGQSIIIVLMQLGGLGTILFGALVAMLFGSSISLKAVHAMSDSTPSGTASPATLRRLVLFTALVVFVIEAIGALILFVGLPEVWDRGPQQFSTTTDRIFHSIFFSVSAFCNAGFATTPYSLEGLQTHWTSHIVFAGLITLGGIGLPVMANISQIVMARLRALGPGPEGRGKRAVLIGGNLVRLSLHTRIVLATSAIVYLVGFLGIFIGEMAQSQTSVPIALLDAHFGSVAARTAGFDIVPPAEMAPLSRFLMLILMFIGGSPGSTAGGIKTICLAILVMTIVVTILGRESTDLYGRRISTEIIRKSIALFVLQTTVIVVVTCGLLLTENGRPLPNARIGPLETYLFEAVSACSTVGLSLGVTPSLSDAGKLVVVAGMFVGRVGSLAFLVALVGLARRGSNRYSYPTEGVVLS